MIKLKTAIKKLIVLSQRFCYLIYDYFLVLIYLIFNLVTKGKIYEDDIVFVSAIDKNFFERVLSLLDSYKFNLKNEFILYDLGVTKEQYEYLNKTYSFVNLRKFDFENNPEFISKYFGEKLGNYAWKPVIINNLLNEYKSKVVWLDAGNVLQRKIIFLKILLTAKKLIVTRSSNKIKKWTHPKTIEYIGLNEKYLSKNNYAGGLVGFDYHSKKAINISERWAHYSKIEECISPPGSSRENHRQDQAVLTVLLYKYLFTNGFISASYSKTNFVCGVLFHAKKIYNF
tara:strand:- start:410 stop:1264 length:855 start_codon:yes stop_codon:yes gene_type:complete